LYKTIGDRAFLVAAVRVWTLEHATTGDHVIVVTADFKACIEDGTVSQIVRQRTLAATAALTLDYYVTFTAALKFCFKTRVAMKFVDDNDGEDNYQVVIYPLRDFVLVGSYN